MRKLFLLALWSLGTSSGAAFLMALKVLSENFSTSVVVAAGAIVAFNLGLAWCVAKRLNEGDF